MFGRSLVRVLSPFLEVATMFVVALISLPLCFSYAVMRLISPRARGAIASPSIVAITGASSGIGAALAEAYARKGVTLCLTGRNAERLEAVASRCRALGAAVETSSLDVADARAVDEWFGAVDAKHPVELLYANAGISSDTAKEDLGADSSKGARCAHVIATNAIGAVNTCYAAMERMQTRRRGQIVVVGSVVMDHRYGGGGYNASKAATATVANTLRIVGATRNVCVSLATPGFVTSHMTESFQGMQPMRIQAEEAAKLLKEGAEHGDAVIAFPTPMALLMRAFGLVPLTLLMAFPKLFENVLINVPALLCDALFFSKKPKQQ